MKSRNSTRILAAAAAAILSVTVMSACSPSSPDGGSTGPKNLSVSMQKDVASLDPQLQGDLVSMYVARNIFDTLTVRDANDKLVGGIATDWKAVDDLTWRFTIREGVKFHNGEPLDAEAVAFSINRLKNPATKSPIVELAAVKEAKVVDAKTVDFIMSASDPLIPAKVSQFGGVIVPPKYLAEKGANALAEHPVGSGPFEFVSYTPGSEIVLKRNDNYWGPKPEVENLTFKVLPDPAGSLATLQAGGVDIVTGVSRDAMAQIEKAPGIKIVDEPGIRSFSIDMETRKGGPLANKDVRKALNYAVDVDTLINTVMGGAAKKIPTLVPTMATGYNDLKPYEYDPAKAKQLLASAGYPNGFPVSFRTSSVNSVLAQAITGQLQAVGIQVDLQLVDPATATSQERALNKESVGDLFLLANSGWTLDAVSFLQSYVRSDRRSSRWVNARADETVLLGETLIDENARIAALKETQQLLYDEAPFVYLFTVANTYAMRDNVQWKMPSTGILDLSTAKIG